MYTTGTSLIGYKSQPRRAAEVPFTDSVRITELTKRKFESAFA